MEWSSETKDKTFVYLVHAALDVLRGEERELFEVGILRPHGLCDHLGQLHSRQSRAQPTVTGQHIHAGLDQTHCLTSTTPQGTLLKLSHGTWKVKPASKCTLCSGSPRCRIAARHSAASWRGALGAADWSSRGGRWTWGCWVCGVPFEPAAVDKTRCLRFFILVYIHAVYWAGFSKTHLPVGGACPHDAWWECFCTLQRWKWSRLSHGSLSWRWGTCWTALPNKTTLQLEIEHLWVFTADRQVHILTFSVVPRFASCRTPLRYTEEAINWVLGIPIWWHKPMVV